MELDTPWILIRVRDLLVSSGRGFDGFLPERGPVCVRVYSVIVEVRAVSRVPRPVKLQWTSPIQVIWSGASLISASRSIWFPFDFYTFSSAFGPVWRRSGDDSDLSEGTTVFRLSGPKFLNPLSRSCQGSFPCGLECPSRFASARAAQQPQTRARRPENVDGTSLRRSEAADTWAEDPPSSFARALCIALGLYVASSLRWAQRTCVCHPPASHGQG